MVKILIADDQGIVRKGLTQILVEGFPAVHVEEAANTESFVSKACMEHWDIVISDLSIQGRGGFLALQQIREQKPKLGILILGFYPEEQYAAPVIRAGASGYLNKNAAPDELVGAVRQIMHGKPVKMSSRIIKSFPPHESGELPLHELLSLREMHVFRLLAEGWSISGIGTELSIGPSTVSTYRARILAKLNMKNNADLTRYAIDNQLI